MGKQIDKLLRSPEIDHDSALFEARTLVKEHTEEEPLYHVARGYLAMRQTLRLPVPDAAENVRTLKEAAGYLADKVQDQAVPAEVWQVIDKLRRLAERMRLAENCDPRD